MAVEIRELKIKLIVDNKSVYHSSVAPSSSGVSRQELDRLKSEILALCKEEMLDILDKERER